MKVGLVASKVDPLTLSIVGQALMAIPKEMSANLMRAAYSTILRESKDASIAILDVHGNVVAQAENIPVQLSSISEAFYHCTQHFGIDQINPNEVMITNDPYSGASHVPDVVIISPIFFEDRLIGFAGSVAHQIDFGGGGAGSLNPSATDVLGEGLIIPPAKIEVEKDFSDTFLWHIIKGNIRVPKHTLGDLNAQLVGNRTGTSRASQLASKYGVETVLNVMEEIQNYSERLMRQEIKKIPDGVFYGEEILEGGGYGDDVHIRVKMEIKDDEIVLDFTGTDPQVRGMINASISSAKSAAYTAVRDIILADSSIKIPANGGANRPITLIIPKGSVINPNSPAPVRSRLNAALRSFGAVIKAFSSVVPERVSASAQDTIMVPNLSYLSETEGWSVYMEPMSGGYGGAVGYDGNNQVRSTLDNCSNTPVEAGESTYAYFRVRQYALQKDTAGVGKWQGSMECIKDYEILKDGVILSCFSDRHTHKPWGIFGGGDGTTNHYILIRNGTMSELPANTIFTFKKGDIFRIVMGASGGYGDPLERDKKLVIKDIPQRLRNEGHANI
jgi:N-methylhydantoinase B